MAKLGRNSRGANLLERAPKFIQVLSLLEPDRKMTFRDIAHLGCLHFDWYTGSKAEKVKQMELMIRASARNHPYLIDRSDGVLKIDSSEALDLVKEKIKMLYGDEKEKTDSQVDDLTTSNVPDSNSALSNIMGSAPAAMGHHWWKYAGQLVSVLMIAMISIAAYGWYQKENDPRHKATKLAQSKDWPALREMFRNPPAGIGRDQIALHLASSPVLKVSKWDISEIDFKDQKMIFKGGTTIEVGHHVEVVTNRSFALVSRLGVVEAIRHKASLPQLVLSSGVVDFPRMLKSRRPWHPTPTIMRYKYDPAFPAISDDQP